MSFVRALALRRHYARRETGYGGYRRTEFIMPAKIITLSQKDQDLLRVALTRVIEPGANCPMELADRIKDLKERLV